MSTGPRENVPIRGAADSWKTITPFPSYQVPETNH